MNKKYLLGIDIGTSSIKALLADTVGTRIAEHTHFYETIQPQPGYVEQDAELNWWEGARVCISVCLNKSGIDPAEIAGICASGMVPCLCPVGEDDLPVRNAILYRDNRAVEQAKHLEEITGLTFTLQDIIPKLQWIKEKEPENYSKIRVILNPHSYIGFKLTGVCSVDRDIATIFGNVYDSETNSWICERMEQMDLDPSLLPDIYDPLDIIGTVTEAAALETGLCPGTPVVCGNGDSYTALVGCGVVKANEGLIYLGTAATFLGLCDSLDNARGKCIFDSGMGRFLGNVLTGGEITRWAKDSMLKGTEVTYDFLEESAAKISIGSDGLIALPHLLGKRTPVPDPYATGVFFGLSNAHTLGHLYRALLEGVAFSLKDSYQTSDFRLDRLILIGGGCKCTIWKQIIADVLDMELTCLPEADNALGTAFLVAIALGIYDSFDAMNEVWIRKRETVTPIPENVEKYREVFDFYKTLDKDLSELFKSHYQLMNKLNN